MKKSDFLECELAVQSQPTLTAMYLIPYEAIKYLRKYSGNTYEVVLKDKLYILSMPEGSTLLTTITD
jgi:hypothetical protein